MEKNANNVVAYFKTAIMPRMQKKFGEELKAEYILSNHEVVVSFVFDLGFARKTFCQILDKNGGIFLDSIARVLTEKSGLTVYPCGSGLRIVW